MQFFCVLCPLGLDLDVIKEVETREIKTMTSELMIPEHQTKECKIQARLRIIDRSQFCLPNVKELAKQFTTEDTTEKKFIKSSDGVVKLESKHNTTNSKKSEFPEKEPEVDYSIIPISEIIHNLQHAVDPPVKNTKKSEIYCETQPTTRMEIYRANSNLHIENRTEKYTKNGDGIDGMRFNGKQVHSLTARSISKEFREGLKNNSYPKVYSKMDRVSSGAESDQGDTNSTNGKTSPTPSIDLKNMKKFWEEIITANSNSTKEK